MWSIAHVIGSLRVFVVGKKNNNLILRFPGTEVSIRNKLLTLLCSVVGFFTSVYSQLTAESMLIV